MTTWGAWSYAGSNGARLGYDAIVTGQQVRLQVYIQTQYYYSGDVYSLSWSGAWAGSRTGTLTSETGGIKLLFDEVMGSQAPNTTTQTTFTVGDLYNGSRPSVTASVTVTALPPLAPVNQSAQYRSDSQIDVYWAGQTAADRPVDYFNVYRYDNTAPTALVARLPGTAGSFGDTGLLADRRYGYYIDAGNAGGVTPSAGTNYVYTTPRQPGQATAAKTGSGDILVSWTNLSSYYGDASVSVEESTDGGVSWSSRGSTGAGVSSWTHASPDPQKTHTYRVRTVAPNGLVSSWTPTGTVQLLARPGAPDGLTERESAPGAYALDASDGVTLVWRHNSTDSTGQTAYEVTYQVAPDGGSWGSEVSTGKVTSSAQQRVIAAGQIPNGSTVRWRVRTWGAYTGSSSESPWSGYRQFYTSTRPVAALSGDAVANSSSLTVRGSYLDAEGTAQTGARWTLRGPSGSDIEQVSVGANDSRLVEVTFAARVEDGQTYTVLYAVRDGDGLWSRDALKRITVAYARPARPTVTVRYDDTTGVVVGQVQNGAGDAQAVRNIVYRDGVPVKALANVEENGAFVDRVPPLTGATVYTVVAVSALPSTSLPSEPVTAATVSRKVWLTGGPGMSVAVGLWYEPNVQVQQSRERAWVAYAGRAEPVLYSGVETAKDASLSALATPEEVAALEALEALPQPVCYRDPSGRRIFGGISGGVKHSDGRSHRTLKPVSLTVRRAAYSE